MRIEFSTVQNNFAAALLDPDRPVPEAVTSYTEHNPQKRFAVYRNNVMAGLVAALRTQFPATERIVGEEFFTAMVCVYIATAPPRSPILVVYGYGFPDFIADFESAADISYLADVARLEVARTRAYHAADAVPLDPARWQEIDPGALPAARVGLHPSIQILRSVHPIVTVWLMNTGEAQPASIEDLTGEDAVVVRPHYEVTVCRLPPGGAGFLEALAAGATLGDAALGAVTEHPEFDLAANLAGLIGAGLAIKLC